MKIKINDNSIDLTNSISLTSPEGPALVDIYLILYKAFTFFNEKLFNNKLPTPVISLRGHKKTAGFYRPDSYRDCDFNTPIDSFVDTINPDDTDNQENEKHRIDEIALNPEHFRRSGREKDIDVLQTLAHEMCHMWQTHFGKKKKQTPYHNKEWADKMVSIGLMPTDTGFPGGKQTGTKIGDYPVEGGLFELYADEFFNDGNIINLQRLTPKKKRHPNSKLKYTCNKCGVNAWAKPDIILHCGRCHLSMVREDAKPIVTADNFGKV